LVTCGQGPSTYAEHFGNALANARRLQFETRAELVGDLHDVVARFAVLYVVLQQTGASLTSGARHLGHDTGLHLADHLIQVEQLQRFVHESRQSGTGLSAVFFVGFPVDVIHILGVVRLTKKNYYYYYYSR